MTNYANLTKNTDAECTQVQFFNTSTLVQTTNACVEYQ